MKKFLQRLGPSVMFGLVIFGTQFLMSLFSLALGGISEDTNVILKIVLGVVFLLGVVVMIYAFSRNTAYNEFNRRQNNRAREKNGEEVTEKLRGKEYAWWKGYVVGFCVSIPLIVITILLMFVKWQPLAVISFILYGCYTLPIFLVLPSYQIGFQFIAVAMMVAVPGVTYHLQGKKMQRGLDRKIDSRVRK